MSSSSTNDAANTITCDKEGDSNKDTASGQLALQIEDLSIENVEGVSNNADNIDNVITCALCGKEGEEDSMNICNKCKMVHYCNVACKKKHKSKHKKKCDRQCKILAVQLHEEALFKEPPPPEDCPICMLPLPSIHKKGEVQYQSCCGKVICGFCIDAMDEREGVNTLCAFCRTPRARSDKECIKRNNKLMEKGNGHAFYMFAGCYAQGSMGMPKDWPKSNELLLKAGELGCTDAYTMLGSSYYNGDGVEIDKKKAMHYYELAAMNGNVKARYSLGFYEEQAGNYQRAIKHFILAAKVGHKGSLDMVTKGFRNGHITKDDYESTLRAYHENQR